MMKRFISALVVVVGLVFAVNSTANAHQYFNHHFVGHTVVAVDVFGRPVFVNNFSNRIVTLDQFGNPFITNQIYNPITIGTRNEIVTVFTPNNNIFLPNEVIVNHGFNYTDVRVFRGGRFIVERRFR